MPHLGVFLIFYSLLPENVAIMFILLTLTDQ